MNFELGILDFIQSHLRSDVLDFIMPLITKLGDGGILWICLSLILLLFRKTRRTGIVMAVSLALEVLCCNVILKPFVARTRPCDMNTAVQLLVPRPSDYSFPSGHTGAAFAAASALFSAKPDLDSDGDFGSFDWIYQALFVCALSVRCTRRCSPWHHAWVSRQYAYKMIARTAHEHRNTAV